jgi:hypothetical protein
MDDNCSDLAPMAFYRSRAKVRVTPPDPRTTPAFNPDLILSPMTTIVVANDSANGNGTFDAHTSLLKAESGFFQGCFAHNYIEVSSREIRLPEDSVQDFKYFLKWLYSGTLDIPQEGPWKETDKRYLDAYILGNKLICPSYQNIVVKCMVAMFRRHAIQPENLLYLFDKGLEDSKLMKYLVKQVAHEYVCEPQRFTDEGKQHYSSTWKRLLVHDAGLAQQLVDAIREVDKAKVKREIDPAYQDPEQWYEGSLPAE